MKIGMTCFNQMWLPISLEEDLSSFERGEAEFLAFILDQPSSPRFHLPRLVTLSV